MKREIKFRAWSGSQMVQVDQITMSECAWTCENGIGVSIPYQPHIPLMQYTGIKDRNGKEIYEGDICTVWNTEYGSVIPGTFKGEVKFFETSFYVDNNRAAFLVWQEIAQWEVIGNIYESPELLEAVNNG